MDGFPGAGIWKVDREAMIETLKSDALIKCIARM